MATTENFIIAFTHTSTVIVVMVQSTSLPCQEVSLLYNNFNGILYFEAFLT